MIHHSLRLLLPSLFVLALLVSCKKETEETPQVSLGISYSRDITPTGFTVQTPPPSGITTPLQDHGYCWALKHNPNMTNHISLGKYLNSFVYHFTDMMPNTTFYVKPYCKDDNGTYFGPELAVTTLSYLLPEVTTDSIFGVRIHVAECRSNIHSDGGGTITDKGICWSTTPSPTINGDHTLEGSGSGSYDSKMNQLAADTKYYVRAYAINEAGISYGNQIEFNTFGTGMYAYIFDDGIPESAWIVYDFDYQLGNLFEVGEDQGVIRSIESFFSFYSSSGGNYPVKFHVYNSTFTEIGCSDSSYVHPGWNVIENLNISFGESFFVMAEWVCQYSPAYLGLDENGPDISFVTDGQNWGKLSSQVSSKGAFQIRVMAELSKCKGGKKFVQYCPSHNQKKSSEINFNKLRSIKFHKK